MKKSIKVLYAALLSSIGFGAMSHQSFAQSYCQPAFSMDNSFSWITNVTLGSINNTSAGGPTAYSDFSSTVNPTQLTTGSAYTLSVSINPGTSTDQYVYAFIDWNQNGVLEASGESYLVASLVGTTGPHTLSITPPATALGGNTRMRIILDQGNMNAGDPCLGNTNVTQIGFGEVEDYSITVQSTTPTVNSVTVATQGGVPATITSNSGTLQMTATVLPATAPQTVTWSIVPGTGTAAISASGLVTAQTNGTVWAKAISTADASKKDSLQIQLTNQGTAVNDLFSSGFVSIYPNPVINELNINFEQEYTDGFELTVLNLLGQEVYHAHINNKRSSHHLAHLVSGTYILSIQDPGGNRSSIKISK